MSFLCDIITNLTEFFTEQNRNARHNEMKNLMSVNKRKNISVRDHILHMMGYLGEIEILGDVLDVDSQINIARNYF